MTLMTDFTIAERYLGKRQSSIDRGIAFDLSFNKYKKLMLAKTCFYTGRKFADGVPHQGRTIDRIDASKGYTDDNVVACLHSVNHFKGNLDFEDIVKIVNKLKKLKAKQKKS